MYACTWTSSHHQKLSLYLLFESQNFLLHNCSMKFLRRIAACFGNVAFMIHISGQIIAALGAGGIVQYSLGGILKARQLTFCGNHGLPGTPPREGLRAAVPLAGSQPPWLHAASHWQLQLQQFFPFLFYPQTLFFQSYWWWLRLCFTVNNMFCR